MKRIFTQTRVRLLGLLIFIVGSAQAVQAQQYTLTDNDVVVTNGVIESCSYNFAIKDIVIPETLDGQTVVGIKDKSWYNGVFYNKGIEKIVIPNTLTKIGNYAFYKNNITELTIPESVKEIGEWAFINNKLTSITIPNSVSVIGNAAFSTNKITEVVLGTGVTLIKAEAFISNPGLLSITLPTPVLSNGNFINWIDGNGKEYAGGASVTDFATNYTAVVSYTLTDDDVVVTNGVIESCSYNFASTCITIPETLDGQTVTAIADKNIDGVFANKGIVKVFLPSTLTKIGINAFYNNKIVDVTIPASVKTICEYSFKINKLSKIVIPNSVSTLGKQCFSKNEIKNISFGTGVTTIGEAAFSENTNLTSLTLPTPNISGFNLIDWKDSKNTSYSAGAVVTSLWESYTANLEDISSYYILTDNDVVVTNGVIQSCSYDFAIKDIVIPETLDGQTVVGIGDLFGGVFGNNGIENIKLPISLKNIGSNAFFGNRLTNVDIPMSVTTIGTNAFVKNLINTLNIPEGVLIIGESAFENNKLTSVVIPKTVIKIGLGAFNYNFSLPFLKLPTAILGGLNSDNWKDNNGKAYNNGAEINDFALEYTAQFSEPKYTISGTVTGADDVTVELSGDVADLKTVNNGEKYTFTVEKGKSVTVTPKKTNYKFTPENYSFANITENKTENDFSAVLSRYTLTDNDVVVTNGVIESCSYDFAIKDIVIPETLDGQTVVGIADDYNDDSGVFGNKGILKVKLPNTLTHIGLLAFSNNELTNVDIPKSVTFIGAEAFYYNELTSVDIPNSVRFIGNSAFSYNQLTSVNISNGVTFIGYDAFAGNKLTSVNIPNSVTFIGGNAFGVAGSLLSFVLPTPIIDGVSFINWIDTNGNNYSGGETVSASYSTYIAISDLYTLKDDDVVVTNGVIQSCSYNLAARCITIPETLDGQTVVGIADGVDGFGVFCAKGFAIIELPNSLVSIGDYAFSYNQLANVVIPNGVTSIGKYAFCDNRLTNITIPNSVTSIGDKAFESNNLTSVTIPNNVTYIGNDAFSDNNISSFVLPQSTKEGHTFINWTDENSKEYAFGATVSDLEVAYTANFCINSYTISGKVTGADGVTVSLSGDASDSKTLNDGDSYSFTVNYGQNLEVLASKDGYSFEPEKYSFTNVNENKTDNNFAATLVVFPVSFTITNGTSPIANATVSFNSAVNTAGVAQGDNYGDFTTNANGVVVIENVIAGNYKYSVSAQGYQTQTGEIAVTNQKVSKAVSLSKVTAIDNILSDAIKVYPNPVASTLNIKGSELIGEVTISNVAGVVVYSTKLNSYEIGIDVSNLQSGVYILRAFVDKGVVVKQFVKK
ncbi:MAG: leucine-rich repeat protein [Bacteroidales bacterium]|nr:leucine-rich repeat protein [Bacteroidales bacterium]